MARWRMKGFVTLKDSWKRRRSPDPTTYSVSSPRAVDSGKTVDRRYACRTKRESSSPGPMAIQTFHISVYLLNNVLQDPHEIPVETTHKADPFRVWHRRRYHRCRVSSAKKWTNFLIVICSILFLCFVNRLVRPFPAFATPTSRLEESSLVGRGNLVPQLTTFLSL